MNVSDLVYEEIAGKLKMRPIGDKVAVIALEGTGAETSTDAGIIYSDNKRGPVKVLVVAVGEDVKEDITPKDIALWDRSSSMGMHEGFIIIREGSLLAIVDRLEG
jgi:co-chaperonin GroES (HSP10)